LWRDPHRNLILAGAILGILVPFALPLLKDLPASGKLVTRLADVAAMVFCAAKWLRKHVGRASRLLDDLEGRRKLAVDLISRRQGEIPETEARLRSELAALDAKQQIEQVRLRDADAAVLELQRKLDDLEAGRSLSRFILERVRAEDYRRHLGIVTTIRKDFERTRQLLDREGVGRVILYIDDLDRCAAPRVVEVLQAVHLFLAMPLFVAVVAVDLRWLLRSLEDHYTAFKLHADTARSEWDTSPQNYVEKIFQVPFSLRSMEAGGYQNLVGNLLPSVAAAPASVSGSPVGPSRTALEGERRQGVEAAKSADVSAASGGLFAVPKQKADAPDLNPASLRIQPWESDFAQKLFPFIGNPRDAKRLTNLYRLLKAPLMREALAKFEGTRERPGDFQAAMLLMAVVVGMDDHAHKLLSALSSDENFAGSSWRTVFAGTLPLQWQQRRCLDGVKLGEDLYPFKFWAPRVGRFMFRPMSPFTLEIMEAVAQAAPA
jgi:hypothetical protein